MRDNEDKLLIAFIMHKIEKFGIEALSRRDSKGLTFIHDVIKFGSIQLLEFSLSLLQDETVSRMVKTDHFAQTRLYDWVIQYGTEEMVHKLMQYVNLEEACALTMTPDEYGVNILDVVAMEGRGMSAFVLQQVAAKAIEKLEQGKEIPDYARQFCIDCKELVVNVLLDEKYGYGNNLGFLKEVTERDHPIGAILWTQRASLRILESAVPTSVSRIQARISELEAKQAPEAVESSFSFEGLH